MLMVMIRREEVRKKRKRNTNSVGFDSDRSLKLESAMRENIGGAIRQQSIQGSQTSIGLDHNWRTQS